MLPQHAPDLHSIDWGTIGTNFGIFMLAISAAVTGVYKGIKSLAKTEKSNDEDNKRIVGASILDNTSLIMWSESNRNVVEAVYHLRDEMRELRHTMDLDRVSRGKE